jgi:all-trans-retinol 13,14-reductase
MDSRVIVIGSGISGLTTASLLARQGHHVIILEKNSAPGGVLQRFKRKFIDFDVGFHYTGNLGHHEILSALWKYLGVFDHLNIMKFPEEAADCVAITGSKTRARAYFSYAALQNELEQLFPVEKQGIRLFLQTIKTLGESIPFYNMQTDLKPFLQSLAFPEKKSLGDLLRATISNSELQAILSLPVFLHGVPPDLIGITMHASVAHSVYSGMYTVDGGGRSITEAFINLLAEQGVEIKTCSEVQAITIQDGKVSGVQTTTGDLQASAVIFTGHPGDIHRMVPEKTFKNAYSNRLRQLKNTASMLLVFGSIDTNDVSPETIWNNYYQIPPALEFFNNIDYNSNSCFFLSCCGMRDSDHFSRGRQNRAVTLMRPAHWNEVSCFDNENKKRSAGYKEWKKFAAQSLINDAAKIFPEIMHTFKEITTGSPLTFRDELNYPEGAVYGIQHSLDQFMIGARTHLPGLWLSGQNTLMPGILGASLSALVTVGSMSNLEQIWQEIRR